MRSWGGALALALLGAATPARAEVGGRVVDASSGAPVAAARVSLQASTEETLTSSVGEFTLSQVTLPGSVIVAARQGYFNGSATTSTGLSRLEIRLEPIVDDADPAYRLLSPGACARFCHYGQLNAWDSSPMARAGTNTWVYDTYDGSGTPGGLGGFVYTRDSALATRAPASECASCHQPLRWIEAPYSPLEPISGSPSAAVAHGVSCEVCHKIAEVDETKPNYPGFYPGVARLSRPRPGAQIQYGILGDTNFRDPGRMRPAYNPQLSAVVCGLCHQDKNDPDLDGDFEEPDGVISEPTYLEWLASPYADERSPLYQTCAGCHMPALGSQQACEFLGGTFTRPPTDVRTHDIRGTSPPFLENALSLSATVAAHPGGLSVDVRVYNDRTGHSVPTGVTIRNVILLVEARQGPRSLALLSGPEVHELGGVGDPATGDFAGLPGRLFAKVNHDSAGNGPTFFTDAAGITFDTRIAALASDRSRYEFLAPSAGPVSVRIRLIYRRSWRALVLAKGWVQTGLGLPLEDVLPPDFGHLMEHLELSATVPEGPDAGAEHDDASIDGGFVEDLDAGREDRAGATPDVPAIPDAAAAMIDAHITEVDAEPLDGWARDSAAVPLGVDGGASSPSDSCGCSGTRADRGAWPALILALAVASRQPRRRKA